MAVEAVTREFQIFSTDRSLFRLELFLEKRFKEDKTVSIAAVKYIVSCEANWSTNQCNPLP